MVPNSDGELVCHDVQTVLFVLLLIPPGKFDKFSALYRDLLFFSGTQCNAFLKASRMPWAWPQPFLSADISEAFTFNSFIARDHLNPFLYRAITRFWVMWIVRWLWAVNPTHSFPLILIVSGARTVRALPEIQREKRHDDYKPQISSGPLPCIDKDGKPKGVRRHRHTNARFALCRLTFNWFLRKIMWYASVHNSEIFSRAIFSFHSAPFWPSIWPPWRHFQHGRQDVIFNMAAMTSPPTGFTNDYWFRPWGYICSWVR